MEVSSTSTDGEGLDVAPHLLRGVAREPLLLLGNETLIQELHRITQTTSIIDNIE